MVNLRAIFHLQILAHLSLCFHKWLDFICHIKQPFLETGIVVHAYNLSSREAELHRRITVGLEPVWATEWVQGQCETLFQKTKTITKTPKSLNRVEDVLSIPCLDLISSVWRGGRGHQKAISTLEMLRSFRTFTNISDT